MKLEDFKREFIELKIELETLTYNHNLKKSLFDAKRFFNLSTVNFLDFKTFHNFKVVASENFYDYTKERDSKVYKSTTKHQLFCVGNKSLKKDRYKNEDVIEKIGIGYKIVSIWSKHQSLKQNLEAEYFYKFNYILSIQKLKELEEKKSIETYYKSLLEKVETEEFKEWSSFIKEIEDETKRNETEVSEKLSNEKKERLKKKINVF